MAIVSGHTPAGCPTDLIPHAQSVATTIPGGTFRGPPIDKFGAAVYKKTTHEMGPAERPPRTSPPAYIIFASNLSKVFKNLVRSRYSRIITRHVVVVPHSTMLGLHTHARLSAVKVRGAII